MQRLRKRAEAFGSDTVSEPKASWDYDESSRSVETLSNWAVDGEARTPKWRSTRAGNQAVLNEGENLELFAHLTTEAIIDCVFCPLKELGVPSRAVIQRDRWNSPEDIVRTMHRQPNPRTSLAATDCCTLPTQGRSCQ